MTPMLNDLVQEFFTLTGMLIFFLGVGTACAWHIAKAKWFSHHEPVNYRTLGIICAVATLVFVGMQNTNLSAEVKRCQNEFSERLHARSLITEENDRLSREQRVWLAKSNEAVNDLIRFAFMPADQQIAAMDRSDPRRRAYDQALVVQFNTRMDRYLVEIRRIGAEQNQVVEARKAHPLPPPTCGDAVDAE